jgi:hypothetical protein
MQIDDFSHLQSNLIEIYAALQARTAADSLPLEASSSLSIYFSDSLIGKIWRIWNRVWSISFETSTEDVLKSILTTQFDQAVHFAYRARQRRIWNSIQQINQVWRMKGSARQRDCYIHYLVKEIQNAHSVVNLSEEDEKRPQLLTEQELKTQRHIIINFHQATAFFWSLFIKDKKENLLIRQPLVHLIPASATLHDPTFYKALKKEKYWVQMEGLMQQSIPIALLAKLSDPQKLTTKETRCLGQWVDRLNQCQSMISPRLFAYVLSEIIDIMRLQGSSLTLSDLLIWLDQQGCLSIHQQDPAHLDWREGLKPGDIIECNGEKLSLGHQLSPDKRIKDTFKIFELNNYPHYVVKIAHNRFLLFLEDKKAKHEQEHWGVRYVETIHHFVTERQNLVEGLDDQGRCVLLEKLSSPIDQHLWTSTKFELSPQDEKVALVLANHIFCMWQWKATAQQLSLAHLMWDKRGMLKSTRLLKKGPPNYQEWEDFCEKAAKKNVYVLSFLMHVSKLREHAIALYYREAVAYTLETGKTDLIGRPLPLEHRHEIYNQQIKKLCTQAQELTHNCLERVVAHLRRENRYSYKQEPELQKKVTERLLNFYWNFPTPGRFAPDLEDQVVLSLTQPSSKNGPLLDPLYAQAYYLKKYQQMMNNNQEINKA